MAGNARKLHPLNYVAEVTGSTVFTLRRRQADGSLPTLRIGSRVMVTDETLNRILREGLPIPKNDDGDPTQRSA